MAEMDSPDQADRDDAQTANTESMPSAGEARKTTEDEFFDQRAVPDEMRGLRRAPRRVDIRRRGGSYSIYVGGRALANFCEEFSEITGYALPNGARQQVLITVEPIGQVRDWEETPEFTHALARQQEDQAPMPAPDLSEASLETLLVDIPDRVPPVRTLGQILERQISREGVAAGILRRSMRHPQPERGSALARSMEQPSEDWRREMYDRLHQEIGQCSEMLRLLERL